ncbi:MAG: DUF1830 domain-containing protein [Microcoleaceae cyanobacterium]
MTSVLDQLPANFTHRILCHYLNDTPSVQVIRVSNITGWYLERVVFPTASLLFEALEEAELEVYQPSDRGVELLHRISCRALRVEERTLQEVG